MTTLYVILYFLSLLATSGSWVLSIFIAAAAWAVLAKLHAWSEERRR